MDTVLYRAKNQVQLHELQGQVWDPLISKFSKLVPNLTLKTVDDFIPENSCNSTNAFLVYLNEMPAKKIAGIF